LHFYSESDFQVVLLPTRLFDTQAHYGNPLLARIFSCKISIFSPIPSTKQQNPCESVDYKGFSGERGIRTPGGVTLNSFQDCRIRPLCHFSLAGANIETFFEYKKENLNFFMIKMFNRWFCVVYKFS